MELGSQTNRLSKEDFISSIEDKITELKSYKELGVEYIEELNSENVMEKQSVKKLLASYEKMLSKITEEYL